MKAVLDTGIFVSALISVQGYPYKALEIWTDRAFDIVTSNWQLEELRAVSRYPHIAPRVKPHRAGALVNRLRRRATVLSDLPEVNYSPDPKDDPILAAAVAGQVQYIVSNDKADVLSLGEVAGIPVVAVRAFVELLE